MKDTEILWIAKEIGSYFPGNLERVINLITRHLKVVDNMPYIFCADGTIYEIDQFISQHLAAYLKRVANQSPHRIELLEMELCECSCPIAVNIPGCVQVAKKPVLDFYDAGRSPLPKRRAATPA